MKRTSKIIPAAIAAVMAAGIGSSLPLQAGPAVYVDDGPGYWDFMSIGDVLLFPYYTVRDDANGNPMGTSFTVTNLDTEASVVVKFRLRDHKHSQDVLDFMWIMSPGDEVVAYMDRNANGQPQVNFPANELTCRVPWLNGATTFTAPGGTVSVDDAQEGHLEIISMVLLPVDGNVDTDMNALTTIDGDMAVHGPNQDCEGLSQAFLTGTSTTLPGLIDSADFMSPYPLLRGSFAITGDGHSAAGKPQAISYWNFEHAPLLFGQNNGVAMPTLLDRTDTAQWDHPHLGDSHHSINIDQSVLAQTFFNNWSSNSANGVGVDWVITYFTKYLWRDALGFYGDAAPYDWPAVAAGDGDFATMKGRLAYDMLGASAAASVSPWTTAIGTPSATGGSENGGRCIRISLASGSPFDPRGPEPLATIYDREEDTNELTGGISPGPATNSYDLCDEANVVSITHGARKPVLRDAGAVVIDASTLNLPFGWAAMDTRGFDTPPVAVGGFSYTLRDLGDPAQALGSIVPHDFYADFLD